MPSVKSLKGVGDKTAALLAGMDIHSTDDLLMHYPKRYNEFPEPEYIPQNIEERKYYIIAGISKPPVNTFGGRYKITSAAISDGRQSMNVCWYNSPYIALSLKTGQKYVFAGNIVKKRGRTLMEHPIVYGLDEYVKLKGRLLPVYALTSGISNNFFIKAVEQIYENGLHEAHNEYLPQRMLEKLSLMEEERAMYRIHRPESADDAAAARRRLAFDDFFLFLYGTRLDKKARASLKSEFVLHNADNAYAKFRDLLPFELTESQNAAINELLSDMSSGNIMNRLLQGDVGSGKTAIAMAVLYAAFENGFQGAVMVPTEVLANQHYANFEKIFANAKRKPATGLLTGSMSKAEHKRIYEAVKRHEIDILIGTHALIQEGLEFDRLGIAVTDEQHRFGVRQRQLFAGKGAEPHILVMSATPIPRTLAVILYGDMDVSTVHSKPAGRLPVKNCVIPASDRHKAYEHIRKELLKGHQAYIICPMVEESENIDAEDVVQYTEKLNNYYNNEFKTAFLHGKLHQKEKDDIMNRFINKDIDILVSTTVIEVGVDVPNATAMLIEDAQRFGLASLHQLRGRVGRGEAQSYCIFVRTSDSGNAVKRLDIVGKSNDGFHIASEDLKLRGPGELFGMAQSGELVFPVADIYNDADVLKEADFAVNNLQLFADGEDIERINQKMEIYRKRNFNKLSL